MKFSIFQSLQFILINQELLKPINFVRSWKCLWEMKKKSKKARVTGLQARCYILSLIDAFRMEEVGMAK
jgi:hypothetical protein